MCRAINLVSNLKRLNMRYCKLNSELYAAHKLADKLGLALSGMPNLLYVRNITPSTVHAVLYPSFIDDRTTTDLISCMLDTLYYLHECGIRCYTKPHVRGVTRLHKDEKILYYCERLFETTYWTRTHGSWKFSYWA